MVPPLSGLTDREMARVARQDFAVLVERLRGPGLTPLALPPVDKLFNTVEYFVHHEDLRRAQAGWEPRELDAADQYAALVDGKGYGGRLVKDAGVPVAARRPTPARPSTLRKGHGPGRAGRSRRRRWCCSCSAGSSPAASSSRARTSLSRRLRRSDLGTRGLIGGPAVSGRGGRPRPAPP